MVWGREGGEGRGGERRGQGEREEGRHLGDRDLELHSRAHGSRH